MARDISKLHPDLQYIISLLIEKCEKKGLKIGIGECVRNVSKQNALYAKGRTASGSIVTNAKGSTYASMHQWGIAFDFYRNDGKGAYYDADGFFTQVGRIGQSLGLEWGGSWTSIVDKPHFQLPDWGSSSKILKSTYGTPEKFMRVWVDSSVKIDRYARPSRIVEFQKALNRIDVGLPKLTVDGDYGNMSQHYLLKVWEKFGWNNDSKADGWTVGPKTIKKLSCL